MALTTGTQIFKLEENEYCYNLEYTYPCSSGGTMKMYVPKLMANIGFGTPRSLPEIFKGDAVFANDGECKPGANNSFTSINWLEPTLMYNTSGWSHILDALGKVPKKTKFMCIFINGQIDKKYFTTNL